MRVALFYFVFVATTGVVLPYFPKYLDALGFTGTQIACVNSAGPILLIFVPLAWGFLADRTGRTALLLKITCAGAALALTAMVLGHVTSFIGVLAAWLAYSFFQSPLLPLADSLAVVEARRIGTDYARLRLWGSVSFIAVSFGFGQYLKHGGNIHHVPIVAASIACAAAACVHLLKQHGSGPQRTPPSFRDAGKLLHNPGLTWFFIAGLLHQAALSPYYLFYGKHLENMGLGQDIVGWSFGLGVAAEVLMFWYSRPLLQRKPLFALLAFSFVLSSGRWLLVASITNGPLMALLQMCHAFTFALCYAGAIMHLEKNVTETLRSTGRALFAAISMGLGSVLGHSLAGWIADNHTTGATFQAAAALDVVALIPLLLAAKYSAQPNHELNRFNIGTQEDEAPPSIAE